MNPMFTVVKREFLTRVKTKGFIFSTVLSPLFILLIILAPVFLARLKSERPREFVVIDMTGRLYQPLVAALDARDAAGRRLYRLRQVVTAPNTVAEMVARQRQAIAEKAIDGLIYLPADVFESNRVEFYARHVSDFQLNREIRNAVSQVVQQERLAQFGIGGDTVRHLIRRVDLRTLRVGKGGEETEDQGATFILTFVLVLFLYIMLLGYGAAIMTSVLEEKTSRVVEVLVSSVRPFQLMAGKILGVGSVGLLQFTIWTVVGGLTLAYAGSVARVFGLGEAGVAISLPTIGVEVLVSFVLFFLLGYFLYATLYAAVGAMVNSTEEGQPLQFAIIMMLVAALIVLQFVIRSPDSPLAVTLSFVPFFTPILMFARIVVQAPPLFEVLAAVGAMLLALAGLVWVSARIYRVGILMYGKRPNLPEVLRWIRY